jgi:diguanylate cyclase
VAVSLVRDDHGAPWQLIAQIASLEARRLAEQNLAAERERLRITLQSIDDAVVTTDSEMRVTYLNAAAERLLDFSLKAVERRRVDEILVLTDPATSREAPVLIDHAVLQGEVVRRQQPVLIHRPDGTISYTYDVVSPVLIRHGCCRVW